MAVARPTLDDVKAILANDDGVKQDPNSKSPWTPHAVELLQALIEEEGPDVLLRAVTKRALGLKGGGLKGYMGTETDKKEFLEDLEELFGLAPTRPVKKAIHTFLKDLMLGKQHIVPSFSAAFHSHRPWPSSLSFTVSSPSPC